MLFQRAVYGKVCDPEGTRKDVLIATGVGTFFGLVFRAVPNTQEKASVLEVRRRGGK